MSNKTEFGIKIDKMYKSWWSFGVCVSHTDTETYLFINFFKWSISIGWLDIDTASETEEEEWWKEQF